jgi:hypothetical protein
MSPQTSPQPITAPTRRFAIGFLIGLCIVAAVLWVAAG